MNGYQTVSIKSEDATTMISAHQDEFIQLAKRNGFDLTKPDWIHEQIATCPSFSKHIFVRYQEPGERHADFIAIYSRAGNDIRIVPWNVNPNFASRFASIRKSTISTFNSILSEEQSAPGKNIQMHDIDRISLARCYARLAGERPLVVPNTTSAHRVDSIGQQDIESNSISSVSIEVIGRPSVITTLSLNFNQQGLLERVIRTESTNLPNTP
jgi:hypothetical protein